MAGYTADEIVCLLKHSEDLHIIVEGDDDVMIYRWLLESLKLESHILPTGGCGILKSVFSRRSEYYNAKVVFVTDSDTFVYNGYPTEYSDIIFTKGYSIENDLYQGCQMYSYYFDDADKVCFDKGLNSFLLYYVAEYEKMKNNQSYNLKEKPAKVLDCKTWMLDTKLYPIIPSPSEKNIEYIKNNYDLLLRGHSLFGLIGMVLRRKNRKINQYRDDMISEICAKSFCSQSYEELKVKIAQKVKEQLCKTVNTSDTQTSI